MEKELKELLEAQGKAILLRPDELMQKLHEKGCDAGQIMTLGLILKSCPTVANILQQERVSEAESNALVSAAVNHCGLSVVAVRRSLSTVMKAAGIKSTWRPRLLVYEIEAEKEYTALIPDEAKLLAKLEQDLKGENVSSETLHDLAALSKKGSLRASYLLGEYYREQDVKNGTTYGKQYYERAARMGYGPANGALAEYMLRSDRKNMAKAAACFEDPTSITGKEGRAWKTLAERLLSYREDNKKRTGGMILLQGVLLALTVLLLVLNVFSLPLFGILAVLIQLASLGYLIFSYIFGPYFTCKYSGYAMLASWLSLALAIL